MPDPAALPPAGAPASIPAWITVEPTTTDLRVARLSVLDRLLVAAHRAGFAPLLVRVRGPMPCLRRTPAWKIPFDVVAEFPPAAGPVLRMDTTVLVTKGDLETLRRTPGRLTETGGTPLPVVVSAPDEEQAPLVRPEGVVCRVRDAAEARRATDQLWASITSSSDGMVDRYFNRPVGRPLSRVLVGTPVTPNQISVAATLVGLIGAVMMATGSWGWVFAGAVLFQVSAILDCVDGDVARVAFKESPLGRWLDLVGDQVVHLGVFAGIAVGAYRAGAVPPTLAAWLGGLAVTGGVFSFVAVLRGMRLAAGAARTRMQRWLDAATSRDFSVIVLVLAWLGQLHLFLWMAALGSHLFWLLLVLVQWRSGRSAAQAA